MRSLLLLGLLVVSGCDRTPECTDHSTCSDGEGCVEGKCEQVECLLSIDCPIENYCDNDTYTCVEGCEYSDDCLLTDRCDPVTATCVPRNCTDTHRDCPPGTRCDRANGQCYQDPTPHCQRCGGEGQCGEGDCWALADYGPGYCFYPCNPEAADPCPASFQCTLVNDSQYACLSYCPFLE